MAPDRLSYATALRAVRRLIASADTVAIFSDIHPAGALPASSVYIVFTLKTAFIRNCSYTMQLDGIVRGASMSDMSASPVNSWRAS